MGHRARDCKKPDKNWKKGKGKGNDKGKERAEESNAMEDQIVFNNEDREDMAEKEFEELNFGMQEETCTFEGNDECLIFYDWLADTATTSHVTCDQEVFASYTPLSHMSVMGVGGMHVPIVGCGSVKLTSTYNGRQYTLCLENVLHVPGQRNSLISLG
jgi:hypothetical protein